MPVLSIAPTAEKIANWLVDPKFGFWEKSGAIMTKFRRKNRFFNLYFFLQND